MSEADFHKRDKKNSPSDTDDLQYQRDRPQSFPTFSQIIDADHFTIEQLAARVRNSAAKSPSERQALLHEVLWRLTRHDISEELVMRPAFVKYMGDEGRKIAGHDREDHNRAKEALRSLLDLDLTDEEQWSVPAQTLPQSQPTPEGGTAVAPKTGIQVITEVFDELGEHMKVESGEMIPNFERLLPIEVSRQLAQEYARTLVLTPAVEIANAGERTSDPTRPETKEAEQQHQPCSRVVGQSQTPGRTKCFPWPSGSAEQLRAYMSCSIEHMTSIYQTLLKESEASNNGSKRANLSMPPLSTDIYLYRRVQDEMTALRLGKWKSFSLRERDRELKASTRSQVETLPRYKKPPKL